MHTRSHTEQTSRELPPPQLNFRSHDICLLKEGYLHVLTFTHTTLTTTHTLARYNLYITTTPSHYYTLTSHSHIIPAVCVSTTQSHCLYSQLLTYGYIRLLSLSPHKTHSLLHLHLSPVILQNRYLWAQQLQNQEYTSGTSMLQTTLNYLLML